MQYMKQKPAEFRTKFWMVYDAVTNFALWVFPNVSKKKKEVELGEHVIFFVIMPQKIRHSM